MFVWSTGGNFSGPLATTCSQPKLRYYLAELESSGFVYSKTTLFKILRHQDGGRGEHGQLAEDTGTILMIDNSTGFSHFH